MTLILLALTLFISGCSLRTTYPHMDWWLSWKVRDYISLNREQQQHLQLTLQQFQRWHQHTQLPAYAGELEALQTRLQQPQLTPAEVQFHLDQSELHWLASLDYVLPDVAAMFMTVTDEQWQQFTAEVLAKTDKELKPYLEGTQEERVRLRQKSLEKGAKAWLGRLSPVQRQLIQRWSAGMHDLAAIRRIEQQRWVEQANQVFHQRHTLGNAEVKNRLRRLMAEENSFWLPEHAQLLQDNRQRTLQLLCDLHASLSPRQRQRLGQQLSDLQQDLLYLYRKTVRE